ncbi:PD-(D/E)XK nuclease-like domain-containing protein [Microbacterium sp.]|uniref:PD-(D/E)XK nuclease-like domain-containing protein n=1 Tax=Microbacterium sp. TaxID=51671 RepID=UPI0039E47D9B
MTLPLPEVVSGRFVQGMDEEEYHAHPALSQTGMKALLRSPRYFRAQRSMNKAKAEFDVGHAAHALVLGVGAPIVEIPDRLLSGEYRSIQSAAAKQFKADAEAEGQTVLKPLVYAEVRRMADAVLMNAKARRLLELPGFTECSLFADDPVTGVHLRGRLDRLAWDDELGWLPLDAKTTTDVQRRKLTTSIVDFGYDIQFVVYDMLLRLIFGVEPQPMHFIFVEKAFPHEVRVVRMGDPAWRAGGEEKMRAALDLFAWCTERGEWPGDDEDGGDVQDLEAPGWYRAQTNLGEVFS